MRQDMKYTWDAAGNAASRQDVKFGGTETFTYDFLDRLTAVSGAYTKSYTYNAIGNILTMNGNSYTYGSKPHAVSQVGSTAYTYDNNGNMITKGSTTTFTWNVENSLASETISGSTTTFVYDGDGNRIKKTEGGQTTVYISKYYEKNTSTGVIITYYYLGDKLVALLKGGILEYIHQDSLGSTSVITVALGNQKGYIRYYPFGATRDWGGSLDTDKRFTSQRLDGTGLYYYGARYYDPTIGRFISPDITVPVPRNPQAFNRYSYCINNPLRFIDPSGYNWFSDACSKVAKAVVETVDVVVDTGEALIIDRDPTKALSVVTAAIIPDGNTAGIGFNFNFGCGGGMSGGVMLVADGNGGIGLAWSGGGGGEAGVAASISGQFQWTNANSIEDLRGWCVQTGGSVGKVVSAGMEGIVSDSYQGVNFQLGAGWTVGPVEMHSFIEIGGVWVIEQGRNYSMTTTMWTTPQGVSWVYIDNQWLMYDPGDPEGSTFAVE